MVGGAIEPSEHGVDVLLYRFVGCEEFGDMGVDWFEDAARADRWSAGNGVAVAHDPAHVLDVLGTQGHSVLSFCEAGEVIEIADEVF